MLGWATIVTPIVRPPASDAGGMLLLGCGFFAVAAAVRGVVVRSSKPVQPSVDTTAASEVAVAPARAEPR
jgi:hypothetical protein